MGTVPRTVRRWVRRLVVACALGMAGCGSGEGPGWSQAEREPPALTAAAMEVAAAPSAPAAPLAAPPPVQPPRTVPPPVLAAIVVNGATVAAAVTASIPAPAAKPPRRRRVPRRAQTLAGALRRAWIAGRIPERDYRAGRRVDARARAALGRLGGVRRAELARVVAELDGLAAQGILISSRLPLAVLTLRRNVEVFTRMPMPGPGERLTFGKDPIVFQHWSGKGVAFHPLATAGKVNALAQPCLARTESGTRAVISAHDRRRTCRPRALRRAAGRLMRLASDRAGYKAWEYLVDYGAGRAPWVSGMAQATTAQALARAGAALGEPRFSELAVDALGAFDLPPPAGIAVAAGGGRHYLMYSFAPGLRILNGFLQSVIGLHDVAQLTGSGRAQRLYRQGEVAARAAVGGFDTGAWSLYSSGGRESTLGYHELVRGFLGGLCDRARRRVYCGTERRFVRYEHEPPRVRLAGLNAVRARRPVRVAFTLSKIAAVTVRVTSRRGVAMRRSLTLARGRHALAWHPRSGGRYRISIAAVGPEGRRALHSRSVRVKPAPKPRRKRARRKVEVVRSLTF